jgi:hypothetical protein
MLWLFAKRFFPILDGEHDIYTYGLPNKGLGEYKCTDVDAITMGNANSGYMRVMKLTVMGFF